MISATRSFRQRRIRSLGITLPVIGLVAGIAWGIESSLGRANTFTGTMLLACLFVLILIGVRRRIPALPLGTASTWLQVHLYTGIFASAIYFLHVPHLIADGWIEGTLSIVFLVVTASGFYGIYASRTLPKRLTNVPGESRFDQLSWHRDQVETRANELLESVGNPSSNRVLQSFYQRYLDPYFGTRPRIHDLVIPNGIRRRQLLSGLKELDRYLEEEGRLISGKLSALVRKRDDLDYQFALQLRLRSWVMFHSFLSVLLVILAIIHAILALSFVG